MMLRNSLSRSCLLAIVVVLLFVTFTAFFESIPRSPFTTDIGHAADESLKGVGSQWGAPGKTSPPTANTDSDKQPSADEAKKTKEEEAERKKAEAADAQKDVKKQKEEEEAKKKEEEERRKKEEEDKKKHDEEDKKKKEEEKKKKEEPGSESMVAERVNPLKKLINFKVPSDLHYDPAGPRPDQIILLTASDGKGHNGGITDLLGQTHENREAYCKLHGYQYHFINITKFDLAGAHPVWAKLPAIADAFNTFPDAQWVWWLDLDAIIMTPSIDLNDHLLSHKSLERRLEKDTMILRQDGKETGTRTPKDQDVKDIDFIIAQDVNGPNAGSFFIRRSAWSKNLLDIWSDPMYVNKKWGAEEQDALLYIMREHPTFLEHIGVVNQRLFNAFPIGQETMGWHQGDLAVHFAGCWVNNECQERWEQYMKKRIEVPKDASKQTPSS